MDSPRVKNKGANKHHDQIFGDFDGDGSDELVFWNQGDKALYLSEIPENPRNLSLWSYTKIYSWTSGAEHEGLSKADIDSDGVIDIIGGGRWFKHRGGNHYDAVTVDDSQRVSRAAVGQLINGGPPEIVFSPGDRTGRLKWYESTGSPVKSKSWVGHSLLESKVVHGYSLALEDINLDGNLDIFCAEMHTPGHKKAAKAWIFYGDGKGKFLRSVISIGAGNHDSRIADLDGDGGQDLLSKPYTWDTPRVDI